jgi:tRNA(Arg) A34 adenosine deaminase TadA
MTHEDYMKLAIKAAEASGQKGGCAIGAVVVKDGQVIAKGMSLAGVIHDVAQHAEIAALRAASEKLQSINLEGCVLYGTLEPCSMCLGATLWGNVKAVYFGAYAGDVEGNNYEYKDYSSEKLAQNSQLWDGSKIEITGGILREECAALMASYKNWMKQSKEAEL